MDITPVKPDDVILGMNRDPVPITIGQSRRDYRFHRRRRKFPDSPHRLFDLFRLCLQLLRVGHVLIGASTAPAKVGTLWIRALGRGLEQLEQFAFGKLFLLPRDSRGDLLPLDRERNKDRLPFIPGDAFAAEGDVVDGEVGGAHASTVAVALRATQWKQSELSDDSVTTSV